MTELEQAMLKSKDEIENGLNFIDTEIIPQEKEYKGGVFMQTFILRALCRAVYIMLDKMIRDERRRAAH